MAGIVVKRLWRFLESPPILRIGMQLKKIASLSAALSNGEDETLVTLKGHNSYSGVINNQNKNELINLPEGLRKN